MMSQKKLASSCLQYFVDYSSKSLSLPSSSISSTFQLLSQGDSVPFIARYRRQETGQLEAENIYILKRFFENFELLSKTRENRSLIH